jgi:hypothetical protein
MKPMNRRERSTFNGRPSTINLATINRFMGRSGTGAGCGFALREA